MYSRRFIIAWVNAAASFWANLIHFLPQMKQLLSTYQPSATAFNGLGVYDPHDDGTRLSNNFVRWIGAESGEPNVDDI